MGKWDRLLLMAWGHLPPHLRSRDRARPQLQWPSGSLWKHITTLEALLQFFAVTVTSGYSTNLFIASKLMFQPLPFYLHFFGVPLLKVIKFASATSDRFFHPHCNAKLLSRVVKHVAEEPERYIADGDPFTCLDHYVAEEPDYSVPNGYGTIIKVVTHAGTAQKLHITDTTTNYGTEGNSFSVNRIRIRHHRYGILGNHANFRSDWNFRVPLYQNLFQQRTFRESISPNFGSYCNNMLLDDVGDCISGTDETAHSTYPE
ncbi:ENHANCED DOWNY MILDEW 2 isoform X2 [Spatholobus suberectus]|nr:ENHANCED DOWNY MILDEW 2 isoform X2 [Spatholobus suberectus]